MPKIEHFRELLVVWFSVFAANLQSMFARLSVKIETAILPGFFSNNDPKIIETCNHFMQPKINHFMQPKIQSLKKFLCIGSNSRRILPIFLSLNHILLYFVFAVKLISTSVLSNYASVENEATLIKLGNKRQRFSRIWTNLVGFVNRNSLQEINCRHPKNINVRCAYRNFILSEVREIKQKIDYTIEKLSDPVIKRTNYSNDATKSRTTTPLETSIGNTIATIAKMAQHPHNFQPLHT